MKGFPAPLEAQAIHHPSSDMLISFKKIRSLLLAFVWKDDADFLTLELTEMCMTSQLEGLISQATKTSLAQAAKKAKPVKGLA
ncbi:MAG: hypothetical protein CMI32_06905 [Opitutales bacterium]|nr:hypothetical protein [Opitutales bacterium]|tara:strand:+ start:836 stop:1084 length:249 start_codon:yes stop_codon:yes gene_type:complete